MLANFSNLATNGSNRTFMELKYCTTFAGALGASVLIVPLWN